MCVAHLTVDFDRRELAGVVRPGACVAMLEFFVPAGPVLYPAWWVYTRAGLPLLGALRELEELPA